MPLFLLTVLGFNGAIYLALGQVVAQAGVSGLTLGFGHALGATLMLLPMARILGGGRPRWHRASLAYYTGGAFLGLLLPTASTFWVIPHVGTGMTAVAIALSPVFTILIAHVTGVERISGPRLTGVILGFVGAAVIITGKAGLTQNAEAGLWFVAALLVPLSLAMGNVYRTRFWPKGQTAMEAGSGISLIGVPLILPFALLLDGAHLPSALADETALWALLAFVAINGVNAIPYFLLQKIGGPVYLSFIGHSMTFFGVILGMIVFGETHGLTDFAGMALILSAVLLINRARAKQGPR